MFNIVPYARWTLVIIDDPKCLPGKSIYDAIQILITIIKFKFIILDDIEGCGRDWLISSFKEKENTITKIEDLLGEICDVKQFDWGDFFLFEQYPAHWENSKRTFYRDRISLTDTTIRAIDDQYIYVYTPCNEVVSLLKEHYLIESIKNDTLDNLDYPE
jgi:hypothetical protein